MRAVPFFRILVSNKTTELVEEAQDKTEIYKETLLQFSKKRSVKVRERCFIEGMNSICFSSH